MRKFSRRLKRTTKQYITVCVIAVVVAGSAAAAISFRIIHDIKTESDFLIKEYQKEMDANKLTVYIVEDDVIAGEALLESNLTRKTVYASQPQETYIDENDIGKIALVDIKSGTQALKTMVTDVRVEDDIREAEFNTILVSSNINENDIVDVRIVYPNGEDYTVLAKKVIKGYAKDAINCFLWLQEEELIRMQSAIVDAYLYTGAYLYTTKYIEPNLQEATIVNYEPSVEAIQLIRENPNVVNTAANELSILVRKALENRLSASLNKDVKANKWDIDDNYIYQEYNNDNMSEPLNDIKHIDEHNVGKNGNNGNNESIIEDTPIEDKEDTSLIDNSYEQAEEMYFPELGSIGNIEQEADTGYDINIIGTSYVEDSLYLAEGSK